MSSNNVDELINAFVKTQVSLNGVSFASKSLKLDTSQDAKQIVEELDKCTNLQYLNLEGNTLGVDACEEIGKALEKHPEFKRALWKDMFTGRMKTEIPKALEYLGHGLVASGAKLTELDLSDNAFGPIGVEGLAALLRSSSCYALEELRLNNNGLGITGGKLLASALTDCYNNSKKNGKPLALKVFIAGRNRLENDGAVALSTVFKMIGTLEEVAMPQNGIYYPGITALFEAFTHNKNLQILNLNDNTIGSKGAEAIAKALPNLQNLKTINFGDCLLKTKGTLLLANALKDSHMNLEELLLGHNEIRIKGGLEIVQAMANKSKLKVLNLDGNQFGTKGVTDLKDKLKENGKLNVLDSLSDNESEDSENENDEQEEEEEEEEENGNVSTDNEDVEVTEEKTDNTEIKSKQITVDEFLATPTEANFVGLGESRNNLILNKAKDSEIRLQVFLPILMKVSQLCESSNIKIAQMALDCTELLYSELFKWANMRNCCSLTANALLEYTGLIKSEDKSLKLTWNKDVCVRILEKISTKPFVSADTGNSLQFFISKYAKST